MSYPRGRPQELLTFLLSLPDEDRPSNLAQLKVEEIAIVLLVTLRKYTQILSEHDDLSAQLAERTRELGEARKESQSFWSKVQRQKENLTNLNDRVNAQGAENAVLKAELAERTRELKDALIQAHGLADGFREVERALVKERDEARAESARLRDEVTALTAETWKLGTRGDEAEERVKELEEALRFYADPDTWDYPAHHYEDAKSYSDMGDRARQALAKENERGE